MAVVAPLRFKRKLGQTIGREECGYLMKLTSEMWKGRCYMRLSLGEDDAGRDILSFLRAELGLSSAKIRSVKFDPEGILLDGKRVTVRERVKAGQCLRILQSDSSNRELRLLPTEMPLDILYEDKNFLFVNKPSGVVCHPSQGHFADSLANGVQAYWNRRDPESRVHLVGRLDKETSGIVSIAKNGVAARQLSEQRREGRLKKTYFALVRGCPQPLCGEIALPMEYVRDPEREGMFVMKAADASRGKAAVTHYRVFESFGGVSLCRVRIDTGRTHQIRFHMASFGHPLLGDRLYGTADDASDGKNEHRALCSGIKRTALHAGRLEFAHPFSGEELVLNAGLPEDMLTVCRELHPRGELPVLL